MIHRPTLGFVLLSLSRDADIWRKEEREGEKRELGRSQEGGGGAQMGKLFAPFRQQEHQHLFKVGWGGEHLHWTSSKFLVFGTPPRTLEELISTIACLGGTPRAMQTS